MKNNKLTPSQVKLKNVLRPIVEGILNEAEPTKQLDSNELKVISKYVNSLSAVPALKYSTNDKFILGAADRVSQIRIEIMDYVEQNSAYKFLGKSSEGWKLVKK